MMSSSTPAQKGSLIPLKRLLVINLEYVCRKNNDMNNESKIHLENGRSVIFNKVGMNR